MTVTVATAGLESSVWLVEIGSDPTPIGDPRPAPFGLVAGAPVAAPDRPADLPPDVQVTGLSDRGWIAEPGDEDDINVYPPRLIEPPAIERVLPIYPDEARRAVFDGGELLLANADGGLDALAGDWAIGGRRVAVFRAPYRRPLHAPRSTFERVAELRAAGTFSGSSRVRLSLTGPGANLSLPLCALYLGTGGAEGGADLAGQAKPKLYGYKRNIAPFLIDAGRLIYQFHDGAAESVLAVRDRGVALTSAGDLASYAALEGTTVTSGQYKSCLAAGCVRLGGTAELLTMDARGHKDGTYSGSPQAIAAAILTGPGGLTGPTSSDFAAWPSAEGGLYLAGGTVADAMDALAAGVFGWWGADEFAAFFGAVVEAPEAMTPVTALEPWMLRAPPEETGETRAPWWRARVGYQALGTTQRGADLASSVSAANREYWSLAQRTAVAVILDNLSRYPLAVDGDELPGVLDGQSDAAAVADRLLEVLGVPRRSWTVRLTGVLWTTLRIGDAVVLRWPGISALRTGKALIVRSISARGDSAELELWG